MDNGPKYGPRLDPVMPTAKVCIVIGTLANGKGMAICDMAAINKELMMHAIMEYTTFPMVRVLFGMQKAWKLEEL